MYIGGLGVGIFAFNRPHYLRRLVCSLENNTYLQNTDFHFFQDGMVNPFSGRLAGLKRDVHNSLALIKATKLPRRFVHIRDENMGVAIQQLEAYDWMTNRYDVVLFLEEDVEVSPYFLRVMRVLYDSVKGLDKLFSVSGGMIRETEVDNPLDYLHLAVVRSRNWCTEMFASDSWRSVRPLFLPYYELVRDWDYAYRPHEDIRRLFASWGYSTTVTSQDKAKDICVDLLGMKRVRLMVNRALYIGEYGLHGTASMYRDNGWADQIPFVFDQDGTIDRFELFG